MTQVTVNGKYVVMTPDQLKLFRKLLKFASKRELSQWQE